MDEAPVTNGRAVSVSPTHAQQELESKPATQPGIEKGCCRFAGLPFLPGEAERCKAARPYIQDQALRDDKTIQAVCGRVAKLFGTPMGLLGFVDECKNHLLAGVGSNGELEDSASDEAQDKGQEAEKQGRAQLDTAAEAQGEALDGEGHTGAAAAAAAPRPIAGPPAGVSVSCIPVQEEAGGSSEGAGGAAACAETGTSAAAAAPGTAPAAAAHAPAAPSPGKLAAARAGEVDRRWSVCTWALVPTKPEVLVVEDLSSDARFKASPLVAQAPKLRFYAGAPIVTSGGLRLGTLCSVDLRPRRFSAEAANVLSNLAELVVQEVEACVPLEPGTERVHRHKKGSTYRPAMVMDLKDPTAWKVLLQTPKWPTPEPSTAGPAPAQLAAGKAAAAHGRQPAHGGADMAEYQFWDVFDPVGSGCDGAQGQRYASIVTRGNPFQLVVHPQGSPEELLCIDLRPANTFKIWDDMPPPSISLSASSALQDRPPAVDGLYTAALLNTRVLGKRAAKSAPAFAMPFGMPLAALIPPTPPGIPALPKPCALPPPSPGGGGASLGTGLSGALSLPPLHRCTSSRRAGSPSLCTSFGTAFRPTPFPGVRLGAMLGCGSSGQVFMGVRGKDQLVAIKVITHNAADREAQEAALEAAVGLKLRHRHVVATYQYKVVATQSPAAQRQASNTSPVLGTGSSSQEMGRTLAQQDLSGMSGPQHQQQQLLASPQQQLLQAGEHGQQQQQPQHQALLTPQRQPLQGALGMQLVPPPYALPSPLCRDTSDASSDASDASFASLSKRRRIGQGSVWHQAPPQAQTWLLMELCNSGTLQGAIDSGEFRTHHSSHEGGVNLGAVLDAAIQVASGMEYLHAEGVLHGDLCPKNVMLAPLPAPGTGGDSGGGCEGRQSWPATGQGGTGSSDGRQASGSARSAEVSGNTSAANGGEEVRPATSAGTGVGPQMGAGTVDGAGAACTAQERKQRAAGEAEQQRQQRQQQVEKQQQQQAEEQGKHAARKGEAGFVPMPPGSALGAVAKVADFGLARLYREGDATQVTETYGTVSHMPPELLRDRQLSPHADVFAFGVILWELYTGQRPFAGFGAFKIIALKLTGSYDELGFPPCVPRPYAALALRCMCKDPDQRPTFIEVLRELRAMQAGLGRSEVGGGGGGSREGGGVEGAGGAAGPGLSGGPGSSHTHEDDAIFPVWPDPLPLQQEALARLATQAG